MAFSARVADDDNVEAYKDKLIAKVGKAWRIYEDGSYYSQTSGGVMKRGKVMRDVDGTPFVFGSIAGAERFIDLGCPVSLY